MWESQKWNGRAVAFGILAIVGPLTIIFILPERHIVPHARESDGVRT